LPSLSFGQEIGVTAIQMTSAIAAVANGGYLMRPRIVKWVEDHAGTVVREFPPLAVRRVIEPDTVDVLTDLMRGVVEGGTGRRAAVPGYLTAGKTGTAQKIDASGGYSMIDHVASFVGFVPASRPQLVVFVSIDEPKGERNEGGDVAAPVFARVAEASLRHLAVPPDDASRVLRAIPYHRDDALRVAYDSGRDIAVAEGTMPDLRGRSAREAAIRAVRRGMLVELRGSGRVVEQRPAPGEPYEAGATCILTLAIRPRLVPPVAPPPAPARVMS
jgi:cell division protein FtsI (penicillin-binding protein 3)